MTAGHAIIEQGDAGHGVTRIGDILPVGHIELNHSTTSKKRLLEDLAGMFAGEALDLDPHTIFTTLIDREKLGSTGIGSGVALPHGRIEGLDDTLAIFMTLAEPLDFDAIDRQPVNLVFALLVPEQATDAHLQLLARLAGLFRDPVLRSDLAECTTPEEAHQLLTGGDLELPDQTT